MCGVFFTFSTTMSPSTAPEKLKSGRTRVHLFLSSASVMMCTFTPFSVLSEPNTLPIEYLTASTPEKINVVLAANDYFDSENIVSGNSLTIDNVKFAYYSRLKSLKVGGVDVEGFNSENYTYSIATELPEASAFEYEVLGNTAKVEAARTTLIFSGVEAVRYSMGRV